MNKRDKKYLIKSKCKFCGEEILKYNKNSKDYCEIHKVNCYICGKEFILKRRYLNEETVLRYKTKNRRKSGRAEVYFYRTWRRV